MKRKKAVIVTGELAQDHEFIYPFYRLLEENIEVDVCIIGGKPVEGILGTRIPPNKNHPIKDINQINVNDYDILIIPGGVKAMEKIRQNKNLIKFISDFNNLNKVIACICSGVQLMISAKIVKGKKVSVDSMIVPGSGLVKKQAESEGLDKIFIDAGFDWREPGCSMCLAMNPDQLKPKERCASTSNRNFEGRQGREGRTHLVSPAIAAASAIKGSFTTVEDL